MLESHGIDAGDKAFVAGLAHGGEVTVELLFNNATLGSSFLGDDIALTKQLIYGPNLDTIGQEAVVVNGSVFRTHERSHGRNELVAVSAGFQLSEDVNDGLFLADSAARTSDGALATTHDNAASSSAGILAWLQVLDITDMTSLVVIVEMDTVSGFTSPTTLITFSTVTNGNEPVTEEKETSGSVERYTRVKLTFNSPGGSPSVKVVVATRRK